MNGHVIPPFGCSWDIGLFVVGSSRWWNEHVHVHVVHIRPQHYACDQTVSLGLLVGLTKWEVLGSVTEIVGLMPSDNAVGGAGGCGQEGWLSEAI